MDPALMAMLGGGGAGGTGAGGAGGLGVEMFDSPMFVGIALHPREDRMKGKRERADGSVFSVDGVVDVPGEGDIKLGWRCWPHPAAAKTAPLLLYFHGNAEIASDYNRGCEQFHAAGASLCVVDFRAYGWSTGSPALTTLGTDAEAVVAALPGIREAAGLGASTPTLLFGRSIGSVCAIHLAKEHPSAFQGLVLESAIARVMELPMVQQIAMMMPAMAPLVAMLPDPFDNDVKIAAVPAAMPLLVLHGTRDEISPFSHGQTLHDKAISSTKRLVALEGAGHNDITQTGGKLYFAELSKFVAAAAAGEAAGDSAGEGGGGATAGGGAGSGSS